MDASRYTALRQRAIRNLEQSWEDLSFENDFVFGAVLRLDLGLCRRLLEAVLDMPIEHVELVDAADQRLRLVQTSSLLPVASRLRAARQRGKLQ